MTFLEPRARVLGAIAIIIAVLAAVATQLAGAGVWRALPNDAAIGLVVAIPGFLLGRTGLTTRPRTLAYEAVVSAVAASIVAVGVLTAIALAGPTPDQGLIGLLEHVVSSAPSWTPYGVTGYVLGLVSTLVD